MNEDHLDKFNGQCSVLVPESTYDRRMDGKENIGYPPDKNDPYGSMYVSKSEDIDRAIKESGGDISKLEASLGFEQGHFGDGPIVRVDINNPEEHGLRMANGKEAGANQFFNTYPDETGKMPDIKYADENKRIVDTDKTEPKELDKLNGQYIDQNGVYHEPNTNGYNGKTSGGLDEAVINQVPNTAENVSYTKIEGFKRGEDSAVYSSKLNDGYSSNSQKGGINSSNVAGASGGGARAPNNTNKASGNKNAKPEESEAQSPKEAPANENKANAQSADNQAPPNNTKSGSTNQDDDFSVDGMIPKDNVGDKSASPDRTPQINNKGVPDVSQASMPDFPGMGY